MNKKIYIVSLVVAVLLGIFIGYEIFSNHGTKEVFGASPTGATFNTQPAYLIVMNLSNSTGTSTSILNSSPNDYYILNEQVGCESVGTSKTAFTGAGLAALTLSFATSSVSAPNTNNNGNIIGSTALTVSTTTPYFTYSSTTATNGTTPGSTLVSNIWSAGSYLTVTANATNTAQCTVGVNTISS